MVSSSSELCQFYSRVCLHKECCRYMDGFSIYTETLHSREHDEVLWILDLVMMSAGHLRILMQILFHTASLCVHTGIGWINAHIYEFLSKGINNVGIVMD